MNLNNITIPINIENKKISNKIFDRLLFQYFGLTDAEALGIREDGLKMF